MKIEKKTIKGLVLAIVPAFCLGMISGRYISTPCNPASNQRIEKTAPAAHVATMPHQNGSMDTSQPKQPKPTPKLPDYMTRSLAASGFSGIPDEKSWQAFMDKTEKEGVRHLAKDLDLPIASMLARIPSLSLSPYALELIEDSVNTADRHGITPLMIASEFGNITTLTQLLKAGADIHAATKLGPDYTYDALTAALGNHSLTGLGNVKCLLQNGLSFERGEDYFQAVVANPYARELYFDEVMETMDINHTDSKGISAFENGLKCGISTHQIDAFLNRGVQLRQGENDNFSVLQAACQNQYITPAQVRRMIQMGAEVNAVSAATGQTPLHFAIMNRRPDLFRLYLENGADPHLKDRLGRTPMMGMEDILERTDKKLLETFQNILSDYDS